MTETLNIQVVHGVNLDLLGVREVSVYGKNTLDDIQQALTREANNLSKKWQRSIQLTQFQTNDEAQLLAELSRNFHGLLINPGAWTHTSLALADRLVGLQLPFVEVHLSNIHAREEFRHKSFCAKHAIGVVQGFGLTSYILGLEGLVNWLLQTDNHP